MLGRTACALFVLVPLCAGCIIKVGGSSGGSSASWYQEGATDGPRHVGSGVAASETRAITDFDELVVTGNLGVTLVAGQEPSLELSGDDNLLELVETRRRGRRLEISMAPGSYSFREPLVVRIGVSSLSRATVGGVCTVTLTDLSGGDLQLVADGASSVTASGRASDLDVETNGAADVDLLGLEAEDVEVGINGSGTVKLHATAGLRVEINGSGTVVYAGAPRVTAVEISGSGSVRAQ